MIWGWEWVWSGVGVTVALFAVGIGVVVQFLLRSNVLSHAEAGIRGSFSGASLSGLARASSAGSGLDEASNEEDMLGNDLRVAHGASSDDLTALKDRGMAKAKRKYRELKEKFSIKAAIDNFKERRRYRWVTATTRHGDGLRSIYADRESRPLPVPEEIHRGFSTLNMSKLSDILDERFHMEEDADLLKCLRKTEIFSWLPDEILRELCSHVERIELEAGDELPESDPDEASLCSFRVIISGSMSMRLPTLRKDSQGDYRLVPADDDDESTTVHFGSDSSVTGLSDLMAAITGKVFKPVAKVIAEEETSLLSIRREGGLDVLLQKFPGLEEELLLRIMIRLNRVTFMSVFRLTGRIVLPKPKVKKDTSMVESSLEDIALSYMAQELGVSRTELGSCCTVGHWNPDGLEDSGPENGFVDASSKTLFSDDHLTEPNIPVSPIALAKTELVRSSSTSSDTKLLMSPGAALEARAVRNFEPKPTNGKDGSDNLHFIQIVNLNPRTEILEVSNEPAMYIVLRGKLELFVGERGNDKKSRLEHTYMPGETFGHLSLLTGTWSDWYLGRNSLQQVDRIWVRTGSGETESVLARLLQSDYMELIDRFPKIIPHKARDVLRNLSDIIRMVDLTTSWQNVSAGEEVVREGSKIDSLYVVLHGRLRGTSSSGESELAQREYGRGALIGEISFFTGEPVRQTIVAQRNTQLAALPKAAMLAIMSIFPEVVFHMGRTMSRSLNYSSVDPVTGRTSLRSQPGLKTSVVAVVPASASSPIDRFLHTISATLKTMGATVETLNSDLVERMADERKLGVGNVVSAPFSPFEQMILLTWLSEAEDTNDIVFYQADAWSEPEPSWWSVLCIEQADLILYVANAADGPKMSSLERKLATVNTNARKELVLLHIDHGDKPIEMPQNTRDWITNRGNIHMHHHIRFHPDKLDVYGRSGFFDIEHFKSDFRRLARWLIGESIGIVLGGGGARGMSHVAAFRCLEELGIPVDFVAGTSIGAYMGAIYAMKCDTLLLHQILSQFVTDMSSTWKKISDLTLPVTSYFHGVGFNRGIVRTFGATRIEDLWLPYFCMTTDLTDSVEIAHRNGSLWRYVRASMTLVNFLPPLCDVIEVSDEDESEDAPSQQREISLSSSLSISSDSMDEDLQADEKETKVIAANSLQQNGEEEAELKKRKPKKKKVVHYLADGGYTNNLPADIMRRYLGPKATILAVDVQGSWQFAGFDYGDSLSGWKYLFMWLNPFTPTPNIPTSGDIQTQLAYISSVKQGSTGSHAIKGGSAYAREYGDLAPSPNPNLREVIDLYLIPPVDDVSTLEFHRSSEIQARAYEYAKAEITNWIDEMRRNDPSKYRCLTWSNSHPSIRSNLRRKKKKGLRVNTLTLRRTGSWTKLKAASETPKVMR